MEASKAESFETAPKESINYVLETFDGVQKLNAKQTAGVVIFIQRKCVLQFNSIQFNSITLFIHGKNLKSSGNEKKYLKNELILITYPRRTSYK